jgi:regulator of replication initiation timing
MGPQADDAVKGSGGSGLGGIPELPLGANDHHEPDAVLNGTSSRKGLGDDATLAALAASSSSSLPIHPEGKGHYAEDVMDSDTPSFMLVASLRSQITDLTSQVTSLNSKLVKSYTQIGDLEDEMHEKKQESSRLQLKITDLEKAKDSWEKEIEGGGWVEKVRYCASYNSNCKLCYQSLMRIVPTIIRSLVSCSRGDATPNVKSSRRDKIKGICSPSTCQARR